MYSLDRSVTEDMRLLKATPYVRSDILVRGFVFDIESGLLREVHVPADQSAL